MTGIQDQAQGLRDLVAGLDIAARHPMALDYEKLWKALRADLEGESNALPGHKYQRLSTMFSPSGAAKVLDRMVQMETLASVTEIRIPTKESK